VKRAWVAVAAVVLLAGCGVRPTGVTDGGDAPTGVAPGVTLYFVDSDDRLRPQLWETGRLGTISEALALLLSAPRGAGLRTEIMTDRTTRVVVTVTQGVIRLQVPLALYEVTPLGIDQIVCTALGVHVQGGGSRTMKVQVGFTLDTPESDKQRTCPLIG
jgi:hypothetical protein